MSSKKKEEEEKKVFLFWELNSCCPSRVHCSCVSSIWAIDAIKQSPHQRCIFLKVRKSCVFKALFTLTAMLCR